MKKVKQALINPYMKAATEVNNIKAFFYLNVCRVQRKLGLKFHTNRMTNKRNLVSMPLKCQEKLHFRMSSA